MKICNGCNHNKPDDDFAFQNREKGRRQSKCRQCFKGIHASRKKADPEIDRKKYRSAKSVERRSRAFAYMMEYLTTHPCVDCDEADPLVLEFDHVTGEKKRDVTGMTACGLEAITAEIAKCEVRCANCHERRTQKQFNKRKYQYIKSMEELCATTIEEAL